MRACRRHDSACPQHELQDHRNTVPLPTHDAVQDGTEEPEIDRGQGVGIESSGEQNPAADAVVIGKIRASARPHSSAPSRATFLVEDETGRRMPELEAPARSGDPVELLEIEKVALVEEPDLLDERAPDQHRSAVDEVERGHAAGPRPIRRVARTGQGSAATPPVVTTAAACLNDARTVE